MSHLSKRIDQFLADLKRRYDLGGMTYGEAVMLDDLISVFERVRAVIGVEDFETGHSDTHALPQKGSDPIDRGKSS